MEVPGLGAALRQHEARVGSMLEAHRAELATAIWSPSDQSAQKWIREERAWWSEAVYGQIQELQSVIKIDVQRNAAGVQVLQSLLAELRNQDLLKIRTEMAALRSGLERQPAVGEELQRIRSDVVALSDRLDKRPDVGSQVLARVQMGEAQAPEPYRPAFGEEAEGGAAGVRQLQDSLEGQLHGIRSDLDALRASLEGRLALEDQLRRIRMDVDAIGVGGSREWPPENEGGLQEVRSPVGAARSRLEEQLENDRRERHHSDEMLKKQLEHQEASLRSLSRGVEELQTLMEPKKDTNSLALQGGRGSKPPHHEHDPEELPELEEPHPEHAEDHDVQEHFDYSLQGRIRKSVEDANTTQSTLSLREMFLERNPCCQPFLRAFDKLGTAEAPERSDPVSKFVDGHVFTGLVYAAILFNCVFMTIAADLDMHVVVNDPDREPSKFIEYGELFFLGVYSLEFLLKLWRFRLYFFYDVSWKFNMLDFALLLLGIYSTFLQGLLPNMSWMRMLRMLKLAKALRVFRLISMFKPLRAILKSLISTVDTLAWSIVMLIVVLFLFALILVIRVTSFLQEEPDKGQVVIGNGPNADMTVIDSLEESYGSVGLTVLHLFMCATGGNDWSNYYNPLKATGWINCLIFLFFVAFTEVAVLNIILGIFVDDAMKNIIADKEEQAMEYADQQKQLSNELREICLAMDLNGNGKLTPQEFKKAVTTPRFKNFLEMMDFKATEIQDFLAIMCSGKEKEGVDIDTFVNLCMRFRGPASCLDMQVVLSAVEDVKSAIDR